MANLHHFRLCQQGFQNPQELSSEKTAKAESSFKWFLITLTPSRSSVQMSSRRFMHRKWPLVGKEVVMPPSSYQDPLFILSGNSEVSKFLLWPLSSTPEALFCSLSSLWPRESWQRLLSYGDDSHINLSLSKTYLLIKM